MINGAGTSQIPATAPIPPILPVATQTESSYKSASQKPYDYLIVGSGFFGSVFARMLTDSGKRVLVIDKRSRIGGNCASEMQHGIDVHLYGAHIFKTQSEEVWQFINRFSRFNSFINTPIANYHGKILALPFNMFTFNALWGVATPEEAQEKLAEARAEFAHITHPKNLEEKALTLVGREIYETLIKGYTEKQWGRPATELPEFIINRLPFRLTYNNNYFNSRYQGIPEGGYDALFTNILQGIDVKLNKDFFRESCLLAKRSRPHCFYRHDRRVFWVRVWQTRVPQFDV